MAPIAMKSKFSWKRACLGPERAVTAGSAAHDLPRPVPGRDLVVYRLRCAQGAGLIVTDRKGRLVQPLVLGPGEYGPCAPLAGGEVGLYGFRVSPAENWAIRSVSIPAGHVDQEGFHLAGDGVDLRDPVAHPGGETFLFASDEGSPGVSHLWSLHPGRREKRPLTSRQDRADDQPAVSPSGRFVAFRGTGPDGSELYLLDTETSKTRQLTAAPGDSGEPAFVDEYRLVFSRRLPGGDQGLLLLDTLRGREKWLTGVLRRARHPAVRVSGRGRVHIYYTRDTEGTAPAPGATPGSEGAPPAGGVARARLEGAAVSR